MCTENPQMDGQLIQIKWPTIQQREHKQVDQLCNDITANHDFSCTIWGQGLGQLDHILSKSLTELSSFILTSVITHNEIKNLTFSFK
jgi:hypothetical protein